MISPRRTPSRSIAGAEGGWPPSYKALLEELDKDHDGQLSKAEFMDAWKDPAVGEEKYQLWDTNKDGYITEAEYVAEVKKITSK